MKNIGNQFKPNNQKGSRSSRTVRFYLFYFYQINLELRKQLRLQEKKKNS
jgi:hypothetical protein